MLNPNFEIISEVSVNTTSGFDAALIIYSDSEYLASSEGFMAQPCSSSFVQHLRLDKSFGEQPTLIASEKAPGGRIIAISTGPLNREIDDVRLFFEAAEKLTKRALSAGVRKPLLIMAQEPKDLGVYKRFLEVSILGIFSASYISLSAREHFFSIKSKGLPQLENLGVLMSSRINSNSYSDFTQQVLAIEKGKMLAKDLLNSDQERMSPIKFAQYVQDAFKGVKNINLKVTADPDEILRDFPLLHAVARCSLAVKRHHPCVVEIEYLSPNQSCVEENLFFVGKGVTFDTGGADLKVNGVMRGMSRDKGGASVVAGFLKAISELAPEKVNVRGYLSLVRNSIGADSYLCDEIIYSRAGKRVLVGNTDAEGRMAMADVLCLAKERALSDRSRSSVPSRLFTVATLTGHAVLSVGPYSISMDNGPASKDKIAQRLFAAGAEWADPFEVSTLRREDFAMIKPGSDQEDVIQANNKPSSATCRGHQFPMAFMIVASGLDAHGSDSDSPIAYTHIDIAGSADKGPVGNGIPIATGNPLASLVGAFLLK